VAGAESCNQRTYDFRWLGPCEIFLRPTQPQLSQVFSWL
jgi:hypothetical protein